MAALGWQRHSNHLENLLGCYIWWDRSHIWFTLIIDAVDVQDPGLSARWCAASRVKKRSEKRAVSH